MANVFHLPTRFPFPQDPHVCPPTYFKTVSLPLWEGRLRLLLLDHDDDGQRLPEESGVEPVASNPGGAIAGYSRWDLKLILPLINPPFFLRSRNLSFSVLHFLAVAMR